MDGRIIFLIIWVNAAAYSSSNPSRKSKERLRSLPAVVIRRVLKPAWDGFRSRARFISSWRSPGSNAIYMRDGMRFLVCGDAEVTDTVMVRFLRILDQDDMGSPHLAYSVVHRKSDTRAATTTVARI